MQVAVVGAGSWGTAVASLVAPNASTVLWARNPDTAVEIDQQHTNERYLSGCALPATLRSTADLAEAVGTADLVVMGVPSHGFRQVLEDAAPHVRPGVPVISLTKGVEQGTQARMTQVIAQTLPDNPAGVLSGPNLAREIMAGHPAAAVIALADEALATQLQPLFAGGNLRVYTNPDVTGAEIAGALKNVIAIAAGMSDGMGFGDNTKATLITRGLAELARLGTSLGGKVLTFGGLAGLGDLVATCTSHQSRNRHVGEQLGRGRSLDDIVSEMHMVAEGVKSCRPVLGLAAEHGVEMPIVEQVVRVVYEGVPASDAVAALMGRRATSERLL